MKWKSGFKVCFQMQLVPLHNGAVAALVGLGTFHHVILQSFYCSKTPIYNSQDAPCNPSDTPREE
jgi:hypothetical protein